MENVADDRLNQYDYGDEVGLDEIRELQANTYGLIEGMRETAFAPDKQKRLERRFKLQEVAEMLGVTTQTIRNYEKDGRFPEPETSGDKRLPYTLEAVNVMRDRLKILPRRAADEQAVIISVQNFKGGVAKSTTACHLSQFLALKGYRVCVVDADPQATSTTMFGRNPDLSDNSQSLFPFLEHGGPQDLNYALTDTYWPQLKLIPANLDLANAETMISKTAAGNPNVLNKLKRGFQTIQDQFDVIIIDPPPALGMIALSVLRAANALVVPIPPSVIDFTSSAHFFKMLLDNLEVMQSYGLETRYKFLKILVTKMVENKPIQDEIWTSMRDSFGSSVFNGIIKDSAAIDNAAASLKTVYEVTATDLKKQVIDGDEIPPLMSKEAYNRCMKYLNAVFSDVEFHVRKTWASHHELLRQEGLI